MWVEHTRCKVRCPKDGEGYRVKVRLSPKLCRKGLGTAPTLQEYMLGVILRAILEQ